MSYLRRQGGTFSPFLNEVAQRIFHRAELQNISILPQLIPGRSSVVADDVASQIVDIKSFICSFARIDRKYGEGITLRPCLVYLHI